MSIKKAISHWENVQQLEVINSAFKCWMYIWKGVWCIPNVSIQYETFCCTLFKLSPLFFAERQDDVFSNTLITMQQCDHLISVVTVNEKCGCCVIQEVKGLGVTCYNLTVSVCICVTTSPVFGSSVPVKNQSNCYLMVQEGFICMITLLPFHKTSNFKFCCFFFGLKGQIHMLRTKLFW